MNLDSANTPAPRPLLTERQVADLLGCTGRTVRAMAARGDIAKVRLGYRLTRYRPEDVEALIEARREVASAA